MIVWKIKNSLKKYPEGSLKIRIKFALWPRQEFIYNPIGPDERGNFFWFEKYVITEKQIGIYFLNWKKYSIERYQTAILNKLKN
jgi:hypothetical protein